MDLISLSYRLRMGNWTISDLSYASVLIKLLANFYEGQRDLDNIAAENRKLMEDIINGDIEP